MDNCNDGSAMAAGVMYDFERGMTGEEVADFAFRDGPEDDGAGFARLWLTLRVCPEKRVSGEAVRLGVGERDVMGRPSCAGEADGEDFESPRTSFREVFEPVLVTCHGDADLASASSLAV